MNSLLKVFDYKAIERLKAMSWSFNLQLQTRVNSLSLVPLFVDILEMIGLGRTIYKIFKSISGVRGCNLLRLHGDSL
jgi:hypothetical protein